MNHKIMEWITGPLVGAALVYMIFTLATMERIL